MVKWFSTFNYVYNKVVSIINKIDSFFICCVYRERDAIHLNRRRYAYVFLYSECIWKTNRLSKVQSRVRLRLRLAKEVFRFSHFSRSTDRQINECVRADFRFLHRTLLIQYMFDSILIGTGVFVSVYIVISIKIIVVVVVFLPAFLILSSWDHLKMCKLQIIHLPSFM